jgi:hypothetical protein
MSATELVQVWNKLENSDKEWFAHHVGEYLEKSCGVASEAGRLGRTSGVDSRDLIAAFDHACRQIKEGT